jgi:hypothetical protein
MNVIWVNFFRWNLARFGQIVRYGLILHIWEKLATSWCCVEGNGTYFRHYLVANCYSFVMQFENELAN